MQIDIRPILIPEGEREARRQNFIDDGAEKQAFLEGLIPSIAHLYVYKATPEGYEVEEIEVTADQLNATERGLVATVTCFDEERELKVADGGWNVYVSDVTMEEYGACLIKKNANNQAEAEHKDLNASWG